MNIRQKKKLQNRDDQFHYRYSHWGRDQVHHMRLRVYTCAYTEILRFKVKDIFTIDNKNIKRAGRYIIKPDLPIRKTSKSFYYRINELIQEQYRLENPSIRNNLNEKMVAIHVYE